MNHSRAVEERSVTRSKTGRSGQLRCITAMAGLLAIGNVPSIAAEHGTARTIEAGSAGDLSRLPADHPEGTRATVKLVSLKHVAHPRDATLSTYLIEFEPDGSAILHRKPNSGYVMVHVLSGSIRAKAWHAGEGVYSAGQTWIQETSAIDIASENASNVEPARALVVMITGDSG